MNLASLVSELDARTLEDSTLIQSAEGRATFHANWMLPAARRIFPALQIYSGISALVVSGRLLATPGISSSELLLVAVVSAFSLVAIFAGVRFLEGAAVGAKLCLWVWIPQVPELVTSTFSYRFHFVTSTNAVVSLDDLSVRVQVQLSNLDVAARLEQIDQPRCVGVGLIAILAVWYFVGEIRRQSKAGSVAGA